MANSPANLEGVFVAVHSEVPLRVMQPRSACTFCRNRKIKCDGQGPACTPCIKHRKASTCSIRTQHRGQERDYLTYLENRIRRLQPSALNNSNSISGDHPTEIPPLYDNNNTEAAAKRDTSSIDSLICDIGALPIAASSYSARRSAEGPSLAAVVLASATCTEPWHPTIGISTDLREAPRLLATKLPSKETTRKLISHYLSHVYPRMPFFDIRGLWQQVDDIYGELNQVNQISSHDDGAFSHSATPFVYGDGNIDHIRRGTAYFDVIIVCSIATSSLSRSADSIVANNARELFRLALRFAEYAVLPNTVIGLQAILFLILYGIMNPSDLNVWYLIGVGMRICVDLGLHQDPPPKFLASMNKNMLETRRRLFWATYSFDRSMSLSHSLPCEISDSVIQVGLPHFRVEPTASEEDVLYYTQRYRIIQLQSLIFNRLYTSSSRSSIIGPWDTCKGEEVIAELLGSLFAWNENNALLSLPESKQLMESERLQSLILIYRPNKSIRLRSYNDLVQLWETSLAFSRIYRSFVERNEILYIAIAAEKIFTTGLTILYAFWQLQSILSDPYLDGNQVSSPGTLQEVTLWNGVRDVSFVLQSLSGRWKEGRSLAHRFEDIAERTIGLLMNRMATQHHADGQQSEGLPEELVELWQYSNSPSSSVMGIGVRNDSMLSMDDDVALRDLVLEIVRG
ncbi:fungal-specific transcription factor domain-containing protein [Talaromyces proteolyticus]|uniref:Fungal-specific transcription factor domain-containing protein n=1 Tax=Talaromyces proteolyticus TaxID=1131652 RepID=A0AAD4L2I2_9EURO|nr:fungal-specific transcription factor domain-containing protein [Talaromyces proteolyticus]KAH8703018.1 fungal-specific transcription factor domain-containing protein [Talaromyces proteolyticus]